MSRSIGVWQIGFLTWLRSLLLVGAICITILTLRSNLSPTLLIDGSCFNVSMEDFDLPQSWAASSTSFSNAKRMLDSYVRGKQESVSSAKMRKSLRIIGAAEKALSNGFGNCGSENRTSLDETAALFSQHATFLPTEIDNPYFRDVMLAFEAVDVNGKLRTSGGDQFILTFTGWVDHAAVTFAYKTAVSTEDLFNGTYVATFTVPNTHVDSFNLTLMHYYTCNQGYGPHLAPEFYELDFGPREVVPHSRFVDWLHKEETSSIALFDQLPKLPLLPFCEATQNGVDDWTDGAWIQKGVKAPNEIDTKAPWRSFHCRMPQLEVAGTAHRIGDSTMLGKTLEVGDPFFHYHNYERWVFLHHDRYMDYLWNKLPHSTTNDVLLFSGGLHQLARNYNARTASKLVLRMVCQMAAIFKGKIVLMGAVPIQQQHYHIVDNTDQNVMWLNALLRKKIHDANGSMSTVCQDVNLESFWSLSNEKGDSQPMEVTQATIRGFGHKATQAEVQLIDFFRTLSPEERHLSYNDRSIIYADGHDFMLPRAECYKDKLHAPPLMNTGHRSLVSRLVELRQLMAK